MIRPEIVEYLQSFGLADRIVDLPKSTATVTLAAQAIGCQEEEIAKSLTFYGDTGSTTDNEGPILVVTSGDQKIDNAKFKATFGIKAKMISRDEVGALIGHEAGGVCPFALNSDVNVYLDESLKRFEKIWPAAGTESTVIGLSVAELETAARAKAWVDVCKPR